MFLHPPPVTGTLPEVALASEHYWDITTVGHVDLSGYLCEVCLDAPAVAVVAAPWGGEVGVCAACAGLPPDVPACLICARPPGPDEDATAYVQHCFDTGYPLRPGVWQL